MSRRVIPGAQGDASQDVHRNVRVDISAHAPLARGVPMIVATMIMMMVVAVMIVRVVAHAGRVRFSCIGTQRVCVDYFSPSLAEVRFRTARLWPAASV